MLLFIVIFDIIPIVGGKAALCIFNFFAALISMFLTLQLGQDGSITNGTQLVLAFGTGFYSYFMLLPYGLLIGSFALLLLIAFGRVPGIS